MQRVFKFQVFLGKNPKLPNVMKYKLLTLSGVTIIESVAAHINAIYSSRKSIQ